MSAEATTPSLVQGLRVDARSRRVLRYAVGATLAMALAMGFAWDLSFLTAVLSLTFLAAPGPPPSLRKGAGFVAVIAVSCIAGLWVSKYLLSFPLIFFPAFGLLLLWLFYAQTGSAAPFLVLWLLIALLVLPMLSVQSPALARFVVAGIIVGAAATLLVVWVAHLLIPEPPPAVADAPVAASPSGEPVTQSLTPGERFQIAGTNTLVVMPVFVVFHFFEWVGGILILIFVALLSMQPGFAKDFKAGGALILGNVMGGVAAIVMFELLTTVPEYVFMLLLTLLAGLLCGSRLMSGSPKAPLYGMAFSTLLLVIGSTTTSTTGDATTKVYSRIFQMMVAVVYVVTTSGLIERYRRARNG